MPLGSGGGPETVTRPCEEWAGAGAWEAAGWQWEWEREREWEMN